LAEGRKIVQEKVKYTSIKDTRRTL
jgi:hypothetical protein